MNRNAESHFAELPNISIERSIFDRSSTHKTSMNVADLVPIYVDSDILPGDSVKVTTSKVVRLQTLLTPVMDNLYLDTYWFFVPHRLVWSHWKEFCGENTSSAWVPSVEYQIPSISSPENGFNIGTLADYFGLPVGIEWDNEAENRPSALPFRAYAAVANEFFRDENLTDPLNIPVGDSNQTGTNGDSYINDVVNGGKPFKVAKYHDYFTSALPAPQKGNPVAFDFNTTATAGLDLDRLRVTTLGWDTDYEQEGLLKNYSTVPLMMYNVADPSAEDYDPSQQLPYSTPTNLGLKSGSVNNGSATFSAGSVQLAPGNLWTEPYSQDVDVTFSSFGFTINELRLAFQLQKFLERNARGGTRYIELIKSHFGVTSPDSRLQRPEYLGGNRIPVTIHEVTNHAQSEADFLGDLGAMSITTDVHFDFEHSFTEHGTLMCLCCLRYDHSYPQGIEKMWLRRKFTDFYLPVFATLGEQPIEVCQLYADADTIDKKKVFGYQEAWAEYRYKPDRVSGEMRPGVANTLASWHFADYYTDEPTLSDAWIREDKTNVDRTLAVTSAVANQAFADFYFNAVYTRPMPVYSIPGLIDHH